jgi:hypothetical protein
MACGDPWPPLYPHSLPLGYVPKHSAPCPTCGHCPTCGRGGHYAPQPFGIPLPLSPPIGWPNTTTAPYIGDVIPDPNRITCDGVSTSTGPAVVAIN